MGRLLCCLEREGISLLADMRIMEKICSLQQLNFLIHYRFGVRAIISFSQIFEALDKKKTTVNISGPQQSLGRPMVSHQGSNSNHRKDFRSCRDYYTTVALHGSCPHTLFTSTDNVKYSRIFVKAQRAQDHFYQCQKWSS